MKQTGRAVRFITKDASVMVMVMDSTAMAAKAERIHKSSAVITAALGRMLTAASMMGILLKGREDSVTVKINGGGPAGTVMAVSDSNGNVRGYASRPIVEIPLRPDGKLNVGGAIGNSGLLHVIKDVQKGQPYIGCTPIVSGEIAEDITKYYADSEQVPTVCALGVLVNPDLTVRVAGGFLLQLLPFCPDEVVGQVEKNIASLEPVTSMMGRGMTPEDICSLVLNGLEYETLDESEPEYRCNCSRKRILHALSALKPDQLLGLPDETGKAEVTCRFCDNVYYFTHEQLAELNNDRL